jgi:hypothetical protein
MTYAIPGYVKCRGNDRELTMTFDLEAITRESMQEIVGIYYRYGIGDLMFFSEEKNQKTFMSAPVRRYPAMAGKHPLAQN